MSRGAIRSAVIGKVFFTQDGPRRACLRDPAVSIALPPHSTVSAGDRVLIELCGTEWLLATNGEASAA